MWHAVVNRDRFIEITIGHEIKQRSEGFMTHNFQIGLGVRQARRHVTAAWILRALQPLAAVKDFAAFILQSLDGMLHHVDRALVDQGTHQSFLLQRIANRHTLVSGQQFLAHFVGHRIVHDHAPRRRASLSSGTDRAEKDRLRRHVDVGAGGDNQRVIATEFHDGSSQSAMDCFRDVQTHPHRTGRRYQWNAAIVGKFLTNRFAVANQQGKDRRIGAGFTANALCNLCYRERRERSFL